MNETAAETPIAGTPIAEMIGETICVIDFMNLAYNRFHAMPRMVNAQGEPYQVLFGFFDDLAVILQKIRADYYVFALESPEGVPLERKKVYPGYKGNRKPMPKELAQQCQAIRAALDLLGFQQLSAPGWEADDVIGSVCRAAAESEALGAVVVSNDKDLKQCLAFGRCSIFRLREKDPARAFFCRADLKALLGIEPEQMADYLALVGDEADGVPGIEGVGEKRASALLQKHGSFAAIKASLDSEPRKNGKIREAMASPRLAYPLARFLVELNTSVVPRFDWDAMRRQRRGVSSETLAALGISKKAAMTLTNFDEQAGRAGSLGFNPELQGNPYWSYEPGRH